MRSTRSGRRAASPRAMSPPRLWPTTVAFVPCWSTRRSTRSSRRSTSVVELARALRRLPRPANAREVRFVLFDGEEAPEGCEDFLACGVRGSRAYLRAHRDEVASLVLLDMVGDRELSIPREQGSDAALWARLRAAARRAGTTGAFPDRTTGEILDDHTPFAQAGIPAIDVIDFTYPEWHTAADTLDQIGARSLDTAGETVLELLRELRGR